MSGNLAALMRDRVRQKAEELAQRRGIARPAAEAWAVDQYLQHLVASGRMALVARVATPLQTARTFGGHRTELEALEAALDRALAAAG